MNEEKVKINRGEVKDRNEERGREGGRGGVERVGTKRKREGVGRNIR